MPLDLYRENFVVQFDGTSPHYFEIEGGCLVAWTRGEHHCPDATTTMDPVDEEALWRGEELGPAVLSRVLVRGRDDRPRRPVPLDELELPELAVLDPIPHADLRLVVALSDSPFGALTFTETFTAGVRTAWEWGEGEPVDVRVRVPYLRYCEFRAGLLTALEALLYGEIDGEWSALMLADGLIEREETLRVVREQCGVEGPLALGVLGAVATAGRGDS